MNMNEIIQVGDSSNPKTTTGGYGSSQFFGVEVKKEPTLEYPSTSDSKLSFDVCTDHPNMEVIKQECENENQNVLELKHSINEQLKSKEIGVIKEEYDTDFPQNITNNLFTPCNSEEASYNIGLMTSCKDEPGVTVFQPNSFTPCISGEESFNVGLMTKCEDEPGDTVFQPNSFSYNICGSKNTASDIECLLVKDEDDNQKEVCEKYELDIQNEIDKCNKEDEKANSVQTILQNNTTSYKCQMCDAVFFQFSEYKVHKKNHYMEKRRCNICNTTLQSIGKLRDHLYKHLNVKPFSCEECNKSFISKHHVKLHQRCHNTEKTFQCTKCEKAFRNKGSLRSHQLVHVERVQEFICKVCREDCKNLPDFRKHMEAHGKKSEIKCGLCNKTFNSDRGLECHISTHKELKFPCEYCGKIYPSMYRIKRHIKRAHVPNQCEECKEVFYDRAQYTKHIKQHNASKISECEYCQKQFDKAKNLSEHIRLQHKQDGEKKKCPICGKEFINSALLKNHVKTHDKCFKCAHCDRLFSSRYNLETHSVTHSGARNHKCSVCQKSYSTKSSLKNHMATHCEERLFQCDRCAKTFKTNRRLYVHKISHATEEKYECEICLQKFRVKQYLKYHMNKHSNNKPFECTICRKRFKHKKSKEKHMVIGKHKYKEDNEHDCDFCDETFTSRDLLLDHFSAVHHEENVINSINDCQEGNVDTDESKDIIETGAVIDIKEECNVEACRSDEMDVTYGDFVPVQN